MRSAITICLVPQARQGPFVFHEGLASGCAQASTLGFDAVEIFPASAREVDAAEIKTLLTKHSLALAAMGTGAGMVVHQWSLSSPKAEVRTQALVFIRGIIDLAAQFGAPAIVGSMQGKVEPGFERAQTLNWLTEGLEVLGEHAAKCGTHLLFEALNRYESNLFNRQADAAAFLKKLKTRNIRLLCDLFHMNIEERNLAETIREVSPLVGHIHFADSNRQAIGFGHTDIKSVITALQETNYNGYLSAEIFPAPDSSTAARQSIDAFKKYCG